MSNLLQKKIAVIESLQYIGIVRIKMHSKITSKYQITIPKEIREKLKLSVSDTLEWIIKDSKIMVEPSKSPFKKHLGAIHVGSGSTADDLKQARDSMSNRHE